MLVPKPHRIEAAFAGYWQLRRIPGQLQGEACYDKRIRSDVMRMKNTSSLHITLFKAVDAASYSCLMFSGRGSTCIPPLSSHLEIEETTWCFRRRYQVKMKGTHGWSAARGVWRPRTPSQSVQGMAVLDPSLDLPSESIHDSDGQDPTLCELRYPYAVAILEIHDSKLIETRSKASTYPQPFSTLPARACMPAECIPWVSLGPEGASGSPMP